MRPDERLRLFPTAGVWAASLPVKGECCLEATLDSDTGQVFTRIILPGTLRKWLLKLDRSKGVSPLWGATAYVVRIDKAGAFKMARPCNKCMAQLIHHGIRDVVYTTDNGWAKERL